MKSPCINCPDRFPACHDTCAKYMEWRSWTKLRTTPPDDGGAAAFLAEKSRVRHRDYLRYAGGKTK